MAKGTRLSLPYDLVFADTCIGGSTVASHLGRARAGLRAFYLADYAVNPLGVKSPEAVREALEGWVGLAHGRASTLVIACNTASVRLQAAPEVRGLAEALGIRLYSMVDFLDDLLGTSGSALAGSRVCLLGTEFTVGQDLYRRRLAAAGAIEVSSLAATKTESAIAHFRHETPGGRAEILAETGAAVSDAETVLLACTCFPLAADAFREINPRVALLDPGAGISKVEGLGGMSGPNRMTVGITGSVFPAQKIREEFGRLFAGWELEEVMEAPAFWPTRS